MNPHQLSALSDSPNSTRLAATLEPILNLFLDYLQSVGRLSPSERCNVQSNTSPKGQLYLLLNILQNKDAGWDTLIRYLEENGYDNLADQLQKSADKAEVRSCSIPQTSTAPVINATQSR